MNTKHTSLDNAFDELLNEDTTTNGSATIALPQPGDPAFVGRLRDLLTKHRQQQQPMEVHDLDKDRDPSWVREAIELLGDVAAHARMFKRDPRDNHERSPDEVRDLVAHLCRTRGTDAVFEMVINWKGFAPSKLPKEVQATMTRLLRLPGGFFQDGGAR